MYPLITYSIDIIGTRRYFKRNIMRLKLFKYRAVLTEANDNEIE